jgi:hypothetical protein
VLLGRNIIRLRQKCDIYMFIILLLIPVASRTEASVCGHSLAGVACSNPAGLMDLFLLCECSVVERSLRWIDHLSRGVLPSVVCLSVIVKPRQLEGPGSLGAVAPWKTKHVIAIINRNLC